MDDDLLFDRVADELAAGKVVGWLQGRMEFGPRALGGRSILGDPRNTKMQSVMNLKIKFRESFRPFAPSVLREHLADYFDMDADSPYMLLVAPVVERRRLATTEEQKRLWGIDLLNVPKSDIPAVTHVDYSARVQTVHDDTNPRYHRLLKTFEAKTGCAVLVNTSFNVRGEPIVCIPGRCLPLLYAHRDGPARPRELRPAQGRSDSRWPATPTGKSYRCFMRTEMDLLVLENCVLRKEDQKPLTGDTDWKKEFELD